MQTTQVETRSKLIVYGCNHNSIISQQDKSIDESLMTEETKDDNDQSVLIQSQQLPDLYNQMNLEFKYQIVQIACGHSHGLLLTVEGQVFSFGSNQFGQRGVNANLRKEREINNGFSPTLIEKIQNQKIISVSAGLYHCAAVSDRGQVFGWGRGIEGQLGYGNCDCQEEPKVVQGLRDIQKVVCGGSHTIYLSTTGKVYANGDNSWGQLGLDQKTNIVITPTQIQMFGKEKVQIIQIAAGCEHSVFLSQDHNVFVCGNNLFGQCGIEGAQNILTPTKLSLQQKVVQIQASLGTFSVLKTIDDQAFIWGTGSWGHARKPVNILNVCTFQGSTSGKSYQYNFLQDKIKSIYMGDNFALTVNDRQQVHLLGTQKLPDIKNPNARIECKLLQFEVGTQMGAGNRFILISKDQTQTKQPQHNYKFLDDQSLKESNVTDMSNKDKIIIKDYLDFQREQTKEIQEPILDMLTKTTQSRSKDRTTTNEIRDTYRCLKCLENQEKQSQLNTRLLNQEDMMANQHRDNQQLKNQVIKQNELIEEQKRTISELTKIVDNQKKELREREMERDRQEREQERERIKENEKQQERDQEQQKTKEQTIYTPDRVEDKYKREYLQTCEKQNKAKPPEPQSAMQHSYSHHYLKSEDYNRSEQKTQLTKVEPSCFLDQNKPSDQNKPLLSQIPSYQKLSQIINTDQQNKIYDFQLRPSVNNDQRNFQGKYANNEKNSSYTEKKKEELERVQTTDIKMIPPIDTLMLQFHSQRGGEQNQQNQQPIESSIRQNLTKSRGLIQSIDTILTQFKTQNNSAQKPKIHHDKSRSSINVNNLTEYRSEKDQLNEYEREREADRQREKERDVDRNRQNRELDKQRQREQETQRERERENERLRERERFTVREGQRERERQMEREQEQLARQREQDIERQRDYERYEQDRDDDQRSNDDQNPNCLIKTYFQRIEQLQQNIAKSKQELRKSLETGKFVSEQKDNTDDDNQSQNQVDVVPISMNDRVQQRIVNGKSLQKTPFKPNSTAYQSSESKSAEKTYELSRKNTEQTLLKNKNIYLNILDTQQQGNSSRIKPMEDLKRKNNKYEASQNKYEVRNPNQGETSYTKIRTLF